MKDFTKIKKLIENTVVRNSKQTKEVLSATIVGSFHHSKNLDVISDIDIVIIVESLKKDLFDRIIESYKIASAKDIGLEGYKINVNSTFGPLKIKGKKDVVFHIMVYDIEGHKKHVEESPFTCHSWEEYPNLYGRSLKEIYPVLNLQLNDIISSRRGLNSYFQDVRKGSISYREYSFMSNKVKLVKKQFHLNEKQKIDFQYHIIHHLLLNMYKILTKETKKPTNKSLVSFFIENLFLSKKQLGLYEALTKWKIKKTSTLEIHMKDTEAFISTIIKLTKRIINNSKKLKVIRHEKTKLNDNTFLGIGRDPGIISKKTTNSKVFEIGYHSSLKRSKETINLFKVKKIIETNLLNEIDYGKAEGLTLEQLSKSYPRIINEWLNQKDPRFPDGENQEDVKFRVDKFFKEILVLKETNLIVTHLVVIRIILLNLLKISLHQIYKIKVNHLKGLEILYFNNHQIVNLEQSERKKLRESLSAIYHD